MVRGASGCVLGALCAFGEGDLGDRPGRGVGSPSRPCCGGGLGSAAPGRRARHRGPLSGPTPLAGLAGKHTAQRPGPERVTQASWTHTPARDEPPLARGARVPLPIRHATWSRRRMESRHGLFGGHAARCEANGARPLPLPRPHADASGCRAGRPVSGPLWRAHRRRGALPSSPPQQGRERDDPRPEPRLNARQRRPSAHSP